MRSLPLLCAALCAAAPAALRAQSPLPLHHAPRPTVPAITEGDLMTRLYILADDSMRGRRAGEEGNIRATAYIARELDRLGLRPAGDSGGYFQDVPLVRRTLSDSSALTVDSRRLRVWTDFTPIPTRGSVRSLDGATVVYGGDIAEPQVTAAQAAGRLVLVSTSEGGASFLRLRLRPESPLAGAAGIGVITTTAPAAALLARLRAPSVTMRADGAPAPAVLLLPAGSAAVLLGASLASARPGTIGHVVHGDVRYQETPTFARNVVAVLPGADPRLRGEYVALGAHNDHLGVGRPVLHDSIRAWNMIMRPAGADTRVDEPPTPAQRARIDALRDSLRRVQPPRLDSVFNGADDDGSGSVALLEIAQALATAATPTRRSLLFVWHTGEELGLLGSRWFTEHPTVPRDSIVAQLNMDMIGRGDAADLPGGGPAYLQLVGSRRRSTELGEQVEAVNRAEPRPFAFDYQFDAPGHPQNIYCRSDHYMYARYGIPVTFFTTGLHEDYHQVTDEAEYIDYAHLARVTRLVRDIAVRLADLDHRPRIDRPLPDPNAPCRQ